LYFKLLDDGNLGAKCVITGYKIRYILDMATLAAAPRSVPAESFYNLAPPATDD